MNNNFSNRRSAPRFRKQFLVGLEDNKHNFSHSHSLNVSATGLRVVVSHPVGEGTPLNLTLCLDENNLVELSGVTVWQEKLGTMGTHVVGLAFRPEQSEQTQQLVRWLRDSGEAA